MGDVTAIHPSIDLNPIPKIHPVIISAKTDFFNSLIKKLSKDRIYADQLIGEWSDVFVALNKHIELKGWTPNYQAYCISRKLAFSQYFPLSPKDALKELLRTFKSSKTTGNATAVFPLEVMVSNNGRGFNG